MSRKQRKMTRSHKVEAGVPRVIEKKPSFNEHWDLEWFQPSGDQHLITESMDNNFLTLVQAPSGCGKSTTVIWKALCDYRSGKYKKVILIKNPTEAGDDMLGFLAGDKSSKLESHIESMKAIFEQFMSKEKLRNDISAGNITIDIPNYLLGRTLDDSIIILEEAQIMSPNTIKLCSERAGINSKVVIVGDPKQGYSVKRRPDGLADLVRRVTREDAGYRYSKYPKFVGYIRMESNNNMRSDGSRFITEIYEDAL
jgi:phosphate starvation-inducible protein PhoH